MNEKEPIESLGKIWIDNLYWMKYESEKSTQYIRADIYTELEKKLKIAIEALGRIDANISDKREIAYQALNQLKGESK